MISALSTGRRNTRPPLVACAAPGFADDLPSAGGEGPCVGACVLCRCGRAGRPPPPVVPARGRGFAGGFEGGGGIDSAVSPFAVAPLLAWEGLMISEEEGEGVGEVDDGEVVGFVSGLLGGCSVERMRTINKKRKSRGEIKRREESIPSSHSMLVCLYSCARGLSSSYNSPISFIKSTTHHFFSVPRYTSTTLITAACVCAGASFASPAASGARSVEAWVWMRTGRDMESARYLKSSER